MESFDAVAPVYDRQFSHSAIGEIQRRQVWDYLSGESFFQKPQNILDINCGTGEDALWLSAHGHTVTATDVSDAMLAVAKQKDRSELIIPPQFLKLDLKEKEWNWPDSTFDAVLSNFAGLNCFGESDMKDIASNIRRLVRPGGRLVMVLFGRYCLGEMFYYVLKGKFRSAGRRSSKGPVTANVEGEKVKVWYHPVAQVQRWFTGFTLRRKFAVGLFQPPSYLEEKFKKRPGLVKLSESLSQIAGRKTMFSNFGDHILLDFERQK